jgi:hypothetical protein
MSRNRSARVHQTIVHDPLISNSAFHLVCDPSLVPTGLRWGLKEIYRVVARMRRKLRCLGVLDDLASRQCRELAALVIDLDERHRAWSSAKEHFRQLKQYSKAGPGHVRKLERQVRRLCDRLQRAATSANQANPYSAGLVMSGLNEAAQVIDVALTRLIPGGETVTSYSRRISGWYELAKSQHLQPDNPRGLAASQLVAYLRSSGVGAADAYVRAARIGHALWAWSDRIAPNDHGVNECPSLRMLICRRRAHDRSASAAGSRRKRRL